MSITAVPRWGIAALPALLSGLIWMSLVFDEGLWAWICGAVPALMWVISGGAWLIAPGDRRFLQAMAVGALLGVLGAILGMPAWGFLAALGLVALSFCVAALSGYLSVRYQERPEGVPVPKMSFLMALKAALDSLIVGVFIGVPKIVHGEEEIQRVAEELDEALAVFESNDWANNPEALLEAPPELESPQISKRQVMGHDVEILRFESEYQPHPSLPGGERWLSYSANREARAMVFRHDDDKPRPWLVCIHGYQMGAPLLDLNLFEPKFLHEKLGCNLILPLLPLHGGRKHRRLSGDGYLNGDAMDTFNAVRQSQWDIRRLLTWVRSQGAAKIGALGYSLGGYNAALLSTLEPLDLVIPAIPLCDMPDIFWQHGPRQILESTLAAGVTQERSSLLMAPLSPLHRDSMVPLENRHIIGGVVDGIIPPAHVCKLESHWQTGDVTWFQGSHLIFKDQAIVNKTIAKLIKEKLVD